MKNESIIKKQINPAMRVSNRIYPRWLSKSKLLLSKAGMVIDFLMLQI